MYGFAEVFFYEFIFYIYLTVVLLAIYVELFIGMKLCRCVYVHNTPNIRLNQLNKHTGD